MTNEIKNNNARANVAPGTYERSLNDKKTAPNWSMGSKVKDIDKRIIVSPQAYNIPSKLIEK